MNADVIVVVGLPVPPEVSAGPPTSPGKLPLLVEEEGVFAVFRHPLSPSLGGTALDMIKLLGGGLDYVEPPLGEIKPNESENTTSVLYIAVRVITFSCF